jgi:hypothetical protein
MAARAPTSPVSDGDGARRAALVVAVSTYADPVLRQLRAPASDATAFGEVLEDGDLGGFDLTTLVDGRAHEIRLAVEEFLTDLRPGDLALVYLSCHGLVDARRRLYFAAADTLKSRLAATGVEARWLLDQLEECRARRQVVILDCCFSGAFALGAKGEGNLDIGDRFLGQGRGRVVLTASRGTEYSFEGTPTPHAAIPGSVFTNALVTGIRSGAADTDDDGFVSVDDAYTYAFDEMRTAGAQQTPQRWLYGAEGSIVLARNPTSTGAGTTAEPSVMPSVAGRPPGAVPTAGGDGARASSDRWSGWNRHRVLIGAAGGAALAALVVTIGYVLSRGQSDQEFSFQGDTVSAAAPWRLTIFDNTRPDVGCTVGVQRVGKGSGFTVPDATVFGRSTWQRQETGTFRLVPSDPKCDLGAQEGSGEASYPLVVERGDSDAFNPSGTIAVSVEAFNNNPCTIVIRNADTGSILDQADASPAQPTVKLEPGDHSHVYLSDVVCRVRVTDA